VSNENPALVESFQLIFNQPMDPLYIFVWDDPLNLPRPTERIPIETFNLLSNSKFDGEENVSTFTHINQFNITQQNLKIA
jgi:hypothetical protein